MKTLIAIFGLYWLAHITAWGFGTGLYLLTSIDTYPHFFIMKMIFFAVFCLIFIFREPIMVRILDFMSRDLNRSGPVGAAPAWQGILLFLGTVLFFYLHLFNGFLALMNYYVNRDGGFYTVTYSGVSPIGVLMLLAVSVPLAALVMFLLRRSRRIQAIAPIPALICGGLAVLALILPAGGDGLMEELMVSQISPISFPDKDVLLWALPALVLTYFGRESEKFREQNRWAKLLSYGAIVISCTFAGDLLRLAGTFLL